ncbi:MAG: enoyl-CoA hydratase-related protein, partial [Solirubrobacteraceae bacterium]
MSGDPHYADLSYAESDGVCAITIERPEVHNAFREQTIHELVDAFDRADASPAVGVIVFAGAGRRAFSTGGEVGMEDGFTPAEGRRMARLLIRLAEAMRGTGKPTIAKIRGWCVGGGNELNLFCDLSIAAESARFAHTDARLGNSPIWYGTQLMQRLVGEKLTKEIIMLGQTYTAAEAARMGWINRAVADDELDSFVADWCRKLLSHSPQSLRLTKTSINAESDSALGSVRQGFEALAYVYGTSEFHEGT